MVSSPNQSPPPEDTNTLPSRLRRVGQTVYQYKKYLGFGILAQGISSGVFMKTDKKEQDLVNTQHSRLDHRFQIKDLTPEKALREITCTDLYGTPLGIPGSEKWARRLSSSIGGKAADILRTYPDTGCVFLSGRDITSVPETKRIIEKIRE